MVTHEDESAAHADRLLVLRDGAIVEDRASSQATA
jgi:putative ABC transport system ATP-binding protein